MEKKSILLVEDDDVLREMIWGALELEYNVLEASNYLEASEKVKNPFDLALVDYNLPDGDGLELAKAIRTAKPGLPIILITAFGTEALAMKALRTGVTDYIKKPLSILYLKKKLAAILDGGKVEIHHEESVATREAFMMDCIAAFIEENYDEELTRDKLAEHAHMDRYEFSRAFNDRFGMSVRCYVNMIRIKKAAEVLKENPELCIADTAALVGFRDAGYFDRLFKEVYGMSPGKYRKEHTEPSSSIYSETPKRAK